MPTFREDPKIGTKVPLIKTADLNDKSITEKKLADGSITKDKIATGAVTSEKLQHNAVTTETINDGAVTAEKIAEGAVSVDEIKDLSVEESKINNKAVTNVKIGDAAVDTRTIEDKSVTNAKIADESITQEKIFNSSVTTEKLANESVSAEKLQSGLRSTIVSTHDKAIELDKKKANVTDVDYALECLENKIGDRVVVEGNVTNLPDDEDLTSVSTIDGREVMKLNDRAYEPSNFSGKGYKILRKNIQRLSLPTVTILVSNIPSSSGDITITINGKATTVALDVATDTTTAIIATKIGTALKVSLDDYDVSVSSNTIVLTRNNSKYASPSSIDVGNTTAGITVKDSITKSERKNVLTQDMINEPNTVYEIRYDFDLDGEDIAIPENSILSFNGGMLINGKIIGDKTRLSNFVKFNNVTIDGVFENEFCKTSYYTDNTDKNVDNINNLFKISRNLIIDSKNYIISKQLILPCDAKISCDIGCSILLTDLGCIYVTHSNRLSDIDVYIDKDIKNTEHLIVLDTEYIYKSIENTPKSYPSLFNIYIDNLFIDHNGKTIDKIIDIYNGSNKNGWNINISNCVFQCSSNIAISLVTKGEGSWLNGTYFNNVKTVYSKVGFYINGLEGSIPPENVSITQCSMQCVPTSTYFVEARSVHRLYVFFCEPWDWNQVETNPFLFTDKCIIVNVVSSGSYSNYDFDGDRESVGNTINYMCNNFSANVGNFYSLPKLPKNGSTYTLKEIQTMPRGVYKIPSDSRIGERFGVTSPFGGLMIIDGGTQGSVFITYYDANKELYFYSNINMLENIEDRAIRRSDWIKIGEIQQTERPLGYGHYKLYRNYNDKLYLMGGDGSKIDCLGRAFLTKESTDGLDVSKLTSFLNIGRVLYSPNHNKLAMWNGTKLIDAFGYDEAYLKKGESNSRPNVDSSQSGFQYYDTTLNKYIVWNGTEWTNMDGTALS